MPAVECGDMERESENGLRPTLWRTARALANAERLALLRAAVVSGGTTDVARLAEAAGLARSTASGYLRMLNARGLLAVDRRDGRVFYGPGTDRSLPVAAAVQQSFVRYVRKPDLPRDWIERTLPSIRAFSHFRRLALLEDLVRNPGLPQQDLAARSRLCAPVFALHFGTLLRSGFVRAEPDGSVSLLRPPPPFATVLLATLRKGLDSPSPAS